MGKPDPTLSDLTVHVRNLPANVQVAVDQSARNVVAEITERIEVNNAALFAYFDKLFAAQAARVAHTDSPVLGGMMPVSSNAASDIKPILLRDADRVALEQMFGGPMLSTAEDVIRYVRRMCSVSIGVPGNPDEPRSTVVTIPLDTLERLDSRRPVDTSLSELLQYEISEFLERFINGER